MNKHGFFDSSTKTLHVATLAREAKVSSATVRHYARIGLLKAGRENGNRYRVFSQADVHRVEFIRQAQTLGLTLQEIQGIFEKVDRGEIPCEEVELLVKQRLKDIKQRIARLHETESRIHSALEIWGKPANWNPQDNEFCPLIERLDFV